MAIKSYLSLIKFSHTLFALPFAIIGFFLGLQVKPTHGFDVKLFLLVLLCMITARSAAMAFNRWADRNIDQKNPRTKIREIPAGVISSRSALIFVIINSILFLISAYFINLLCFLLAPIALFIILMYSYTKRFSWLCHIFLGLGLSLAPIGAFLAVTGEFYVLPLLYSVAVISWVAGFDILYALQDIDFDQQEKLKSIPAKFGVSKAMFISNSLHVITAICIIACSNILIHQFHLSYLLMFGTLCFLLLLFYQHWIVKDGNLERINLAFFTTNGIASVILALCTVADIYL